MKKLILDASKFNLMVERMENRYTLEETKIKERNLILEGFPKGIIGDILGGIGKTADEIETAMKNAGIRLGSIEGQNFLKGLNFFNDPPINFRNWNDFDMSSFKSTLKKLNPAKTTDAILDKLDSIVDVSKEMEKVGNPVSNLIQTLDANGFGLEEAESILDDTLSAYPDMFKNSDIQPVNGSKVFKEGDSVGNFVRRSIIKPNGQFVAGVPSRTQTRIVGEYLKDGGKQGDIELRDGDGNGPKSDEEVIVDPDTGLTYYGKFKERMKKILGSKAVKYIWKGSGMDLWWRVIGGKKLFKKVDDPIQQSFGEIAKTYGIYGARVVRVAVFGVITPLPPALYYMLYDCIFNGYFGNEDRVVKDLDKPIIDGKIQVKDYEFSFWECIGGDPKYDAETGERVYGPAGNAQLAWPVATVFIPTIAENLVTQYLSNPVKKGIKEGEEILNQELKNIFEVDYNDPKNSFKNLLKTKCDSSIVDPLKEQFINRLKTITKMDGVVWAKILQWWPTDYGADFESKLNLTEDQTNRVLEVFGDIESLIEFQKELKNQYKDYIPKDKSNDTLTISDMVKYKCQAMRINAITKVVSLLKDGKYWFPKETQPTKNKNSEYCDNINFWISLSTPIGSEEWSNSECTDMKNEVIEISDLINSIPKYKDVKTVNSMLDPMVWEETCKDLNNIMSDGNTDLLNWLCETGAENGVVDMEIDVAEIEVIIYYYTWQKYTEKDIVITTAHDIIDTINQTAALKGEYLIKPNEEGSGVTENEEGLLEYDLCNPNVQKVWIDDYWCIPKRITKEGNDNGKKTSDCINDFKEYLKEKNIC